MTDSLIDPSNEWFASVINQYFKRRFGETSHRLYKSTKSLSPSVTFKTWPTLNCYNDNQILDNVLLAAFDGINAERKKDITMAKRIAKDLEHLMISVLPDEFGSTFQPKSTINPSIHKTFPPKQEHPPANLNDLIQITKRPYSTLARQFPSPRNGFALHWPPIPGPILNRLNKPIKSVLQLTKRL